MKKIKTPEEYLLDTSRCTIDDDADLDINENFFFQWRDILETLKKAQLDMLEYAVEKCADNADADYNTLDSFDRITGENIEVYVIKQSILNTIDEIKKELE